MESCVPHVFDRKSDYVKRSFKIFLGQQIKRKWSQLAVPWSKAFWSTAVVSVSHSVSSVSASACQSSGPKGVSPGQKALALAKRRYSTVLNLLFSPINIEVKSGEHRGTSKCQLHFVGRQGSSESPNCLDVRRLQMVKGLHHDFLALQGEGPLQHWLERCGNRVHGILKHRKQWQCWKGY